MIDSDDQLGEPDEGNFPYDGEDIPDELDVENLDELLEGVDPDAIEEPDDEVDN